MSFHYNFPQKSVFGKVMPKSKIYENASPSARVRKFFVQEVAEILWAYKLAPLTTNIPANDGVQEIQVFTIALKTGNLKHEVLTAIDKAIPSPIIFILTYQNKIRYTAAYKRKSEADKSKWVVSGYFASEWLPQDAEAVPLPIVLDLDALYHNILKTIIPVSARPNETIDELVARFDLLQAKEREAAKIESRLEKEKQFNRKVEINGQLRKINQEISMLKC